MRLLIVMGIPSGCGGQGKTHPVRPERATLR
jgi:hypothetical protein